MKNGLIMSTVNKDLRFMGKISSSTFYANKEHFDSRLIEALSQRDREIIKLKDIVYKRIFSGRKQKKTSLFFRNH